jgi:CRP-like cAMP-binding protein
VNQRLARWLLMTHDRTRGDQLHLTHQFLADMLGVRRSAITIAAGLLQERGVIQYSRGEIQVLDRAALEASSCECYAAVIGDYEQLLG